MKTAVVVLVVVSGSLFWGPLHADIFTNSADINNDKKVDMPDLAALAAAWLSNDTPTAGWNPLCDISELRDGVVNELDLAVVAANWLWSAPDAMVLIDAGEFDMGDHFAEGRADELPTHTVHINSFGISKFEVTTQQYCAFLNSTLSNGMIQVNEGIVSDASSGQVPYCLTYSNDFHSQIDYRPAMFSVRTKYGVDMSNHPMVEVSWFGAAAYCNWRSLREGYETCYDPATWECDFSKSGYRLPTEAEWEYAARGGEGDPYYRYPWGDTIDGSNANYWSSGDEFDSGAHPGTSPVGYYDGSQIPAGVDMANGYGLYDMAGNVLEWCNDRYDSGYYDVSPLDNPTGPAGGDHRVLRGGSWITDTSPCRTAYRYYDYPDTPLNFAGFRVALGLN